MHDGTLRAVVQRNAVHVVEALPVVGSAPALAFVLAFVLASVGASPSHAWLDAGELAAAGAELGVMHPPGSPGLAAFWQIATAFPLGPMGWRMALVSSLATALAAWFTMRLFERRGVHPLVSWGAIAWLLAGTTLLRHARGVELYAPALAALAWVADGFDPAREPSARLGPRLVAVFVGTWAIWCFAELRLLLPPMFAIAWISAVRQRRPFAAWAPIVVVFATASVAAIPLGSARDPVVDWGDPQTLGALVDHLLARSIRTAYVDEMLPRSTAMWLANAEAMVARLGEDLGPSGPVLGTVAMTAALVGPTKLADRRASVTMIAWALGAAFYAVGVNPMGGIDRQTGLVLAWCIVVMVAVMLDRWSSARPRLRTAVLPLAWMVLVLPAALRSWSDAGTMRSWAPHAWTRATLAQLPPRSLLLTQSDDLSAGVVWARVVEGARPDIVSWPGQHLHRPPAPSRRTADLAMWSAVAEASSESAKIEAAIASHDGVVALEHAGSGVFATVRFAGTPSALPLSMTAAGADGPGVAAQIAAWLPGLRTSDDRHRLAVAVAEWARGHIRRGGDLGEAIAALQTNLVDVDPDHVSSMVTLGSAFDRAGDQESAIDWTRRALEREPTRQAALLNLALYLARPMPQLDPTAQRERWGEAEALAQRACDLRPWKPETWQRLAEVRAAAGDAAGADEAHGRAQRTARSPPAP